MYCQLLPFNATGACVPRDLRMFESRLPFVSRLFASTQVAIHILFASETHPEDNRPHERIYGVLLQVAGLST